jgi:hypothetical protein
VEIIFQKRGEAMELLASPNSPKTSAAKAKPKIVLN